MGNARLAAVFGLWAATFIGGLWSLRPAVLSSSPMAVSFVTAVTWR